MGDARVCLSNMPSPLGRSSKSDRCLGSEVGSSIADVLILCGTRALEPAVTCLQQHQHLHRPSLTRPNRRPKLALPRH